MYLNRVFTREEISELLRARPHLVGKIVVYEVLDDDATVSEADSLPLPRGAPTGGSAFLLVEVVE